MYVRDCKRDPLPSVRIFSPQWVVRGFSQRPGFDFGKALSPVVKPDTIRTVLTLIASRQWPVEQLDVSNAFLHGHLTDFSPSLESRTWGPFVPSSAQQTADIMTKGLPSSVFRDFWSSLNVDDPPLRLQGC